jgi:diguanylate cyclase (GGDEF)-like protein
MPIFSRPLSELPKFVAVVVVGMGLLSASVVVGVHFAIDRAVAADAGERADDWARYFIATLPDIDNLLGGAKLDAAQQQIVSTAAGVGDVFRFKLYDPKGMARVESDSETFGKDSDGGEGDHVEREVFDVIEDRAPSISLNDGSKERDMPALYAEAYVPVWRADGSLRAVVETYVDETKTAQFFNTSFTVLAAALGLGIALAFGVPMLLFLVRSQQAREDASRAKFLASHDPMTNLLNRASVDEQLRARIAAAAPGKQLAAVLFDVDEFKAINDSFGHQAGDAFLKHVASSIAGVTAEGDFVARAGGDEFIVALTRANEIDLIAAVEAIRNAARKPLSIGGMLVSGRLSAGICMVLSPAESTGDVLHHADVALYQAKIDGGDTVRQFSADMEHRIRARRALEQLLRDAVANCRFELHYQPLLDVKSKACVGFEALMRLKDASGTPVPPMTFIPVAEQMGLIDQIGKWALEEATRTAAAWPAPMFVSVNLSVRQFASGELVKEVAAALAASGLDAGRLELEVTESLLMENTEAVVRQLDALKALGVSIAMDDFGTGYSSLGYLWQFAFDKLKIDRSFIKALDVDPKKGRDILDTIVLLAHRLDMRVTAEGIETEAQAKILSDLACDQFQGYLYGKPGPADAIAAQLLHRAGDDLRAEPPIATSNAA